MMFKTRYIALVFMMLTLPAVFFTSCTKILGPTKVEIEDSVRHYLPVVLGDDVRMVWVIKNVGNENLIIKDIQPSNGSIEFKSIESTLIPPGSEEKVYLVFHSSKNVGYAEHKIRIFGNIEPDGVAEMKFDIHIVRPTLDRTDYEEIYFDHESSRVDEEAFKKARLNKAYYTDDDPIDPVDEPEPEESAQNSRVVKELQRNGEGMQNKESNGEKSITLDWVNGQAIAYLEGDEAGLATVTAFDYDSATTTVLILGDDYPIAEADMVTMPAAGNPILLLFMILSILLCSVGLFRRK